MLDKLAEALGELIVFVEKTTKRFVTGVKESIEKNRNK